MHSIVPLEDAVPDIVAVRHMGYGKRPGVNVSGKQTSFGFFGA